MKMKSTKSALLMSFTSLLLCFAMLIGCTFAWFTDSVTSGVNKIVAGNLDVEVQYTKDNGSTWHDLASAADLFQAGLWEPGHTEYVTLKIENKGTLALNYKVMVTPVTEKGGVNVSGQSFKLSDYLMFGTKSETDEPSYSDRAAARAAVSATATGLSQANLTKTGTMMAGNEIPPQYITLVVYMPENVGNEANYKTGTAAPEIELGITVVATQLGDESNNNAIEVEADSFGDNYDVGAKTNASEYVVGPVYDYFPQVAASAPVVTGDNTVITAEGKLNKDDTVNTTLARVTVPADALAEGATKVSVSVIPKAATNQLAQTTIQTEKNAGRETANFDIKVDGIKSGNETEITVEVFVGKGLSNVKVYHNGDEITGATYDDATGIATFKTTSFSDYTISYDPATAAIGTKTYGTLALAVAAAQAGDVVTMLDDATITDTIEIRNAITLKGSGYTATVPATKLLGSLQLPAFKVSADGVTFDGMKIDLADGASYHGTAVLVDGANFTFENGAIIGGYNASGYEATHGFNTCVAILLEGSKNNAKITNNTIVGCEYALQVCAYSTPIVFTNNKIEHSIYFGCAVAADGLTVSGNTKAAQATAPADAGEARVVLYGDAHNDDLAKALVSCGLPVYWTDDFATYTNCFTAKVGSNFYGTLAEAVTAANAGDTVEILAPGTYKVPGIPNNITIKATVDGVVFDCTGAANSSIASIPGGCTFENVKLEFGGAGYHGFQHAGKIIFKNCLLKDAFTCYSAIDFVDCQFDLTKTADYVWTYGCEVTFTGCTFNTLGKAILCYNEGAQLTGPSGVNNISVTNCTFNATAGAMASAISNQNCAAIEIDNFGKGVNLTLSGNTVQKGDNAFSGEWRIKRYVEPDTDKVIVNGTEYKQIALDGKLMEISETEVSFPTN